MHRKHKTRLSCSVKIEVSSLACGQTGGHPKGAGHHSRDVLFILPLVLKDSCPNRYITCHIQSCLTPCNGPASVHNTTSRIMAQADVANFTILFSTKGSSCGTNCGRSGTGRGLSPITSVFLCQNYFADPPLPLTCVAMGGQWAPFGP